MDEISKINIFGHNAINKVDADLPKKQKSKAEDNKGDVKEKNVEQNTKKAGEEVLDSMNLMGLMNKAQIGVKSVNPRDYLSEDRIKDIEESMGIFEKGVEEHAKVIREEFGQIPLSEATINALAAQAFSLM